MNLLHFPPEILEQILGYTVCGENWWPSPSTGKFLELRAVCSKSFLRATTWCPVDAIELFISIPCHIFNAFDVFECLVIGIKGSK
jgi:hypothetical protein